ncbi:MAG: hypothetical protein ACFCU7_18765 [Pleurocapsa sp.]
MKTAKNTKILNILFILALAFSAIALIVDIDSTLTYIGTDLRNRVVAGRLVLQGIDPYFFKWQPGLSERLYDPLDIPGELLSKVSVPPTVIALHSIIAPLSYLQQKVIWLMVQWVAFIATVVIFLKTSDSKLKTNSTIAIGFFLSTVYFGVSTLTLVKYI